MSLPLTDVQLEKLRRKRVGPSGNRLRAAIKLAGCTQTDLAKASGVSISYTADLARGRVFAPAIDMAYKFADALGCGIEDLFPRRDPKKVAA